jgi:hypothetical protein
MLADGDMTQEEYRQDVQVERETLATLQAAMVEAQARGAVAGAVLPEWPVVAARFGEWGRLLESGSVAGVRDVLSELVVAFKPRRPEGWTGTRGQWVLKPEWTPLGEALRDLGDAIRELVAA